MLLFFSNNKQLELRNKPLNKGRLCWTEFHSATSPIFYSVSAKHIRTIFFCAPAVEMTFSLSK